MILEIFLRKELLTCGTLYHPWLSKHRRFNSLNCFKARLDEFWSNQDVLRNFKAPFLGTGSRSYYTLIVSFILLRI